MQSKIDLTKYNDVALAWLACDVSNEMRKRADMTDTKFWEKTHGQEAVKRAISVAAVQKHTILCIGPEADTAVVLAIQLGVAAASIDADSKSLKREMRRWNMHVEAPLFVKSVIGSTASLESATEVVRKAREIFNKSPNLYAGQPLLTQPASDLFRAAIREIGINSTRMRMLQEIGASVAALNGHDIVQLEDISEAVYYFLDR